MHFREDLHVNAYGRLEAFAQYATAPAACYGITQEDRGASILDLPGLSIFWAS